VAIRHEPSNKTHSASEMKLNRVRAFIMIA
jgi:hypothetical protein